MNLKKVSYFFTLGDTGYSETIIIYKYNSENKVEQSNIYKWRDVPVEIVHKPLGK